MIDTQDLRMLRIPAEADRGVALDELAAVFALRTVGETDDLIESLSDDAIREWRLSDAMFWQRVKFRARRLRAVGRPGESGGLTIEGKG